MNNIPLPASLRGPRSKDSSPGPASVRSNSSMVTDHSLADDTDLESNLVGGADSILDTTIDESEIDENPQDVLLLIPDDMQKFLEEKYNQTISKNRAAADSTVPSPKTPAGGRSRSGPGTPAFPQPKPPSRNSNLGEEEVERSPCMHSKPSSKAGSRENSVTRCRQTPPGPSCEQPNSRLTNRVPSNPPPAKMNPQANNPAAMNNARPEQNTMQGPMHMQGGAMMQNWHQGAMNYNQQMANYPPTNWPNQMHPSGQNMPYNMGPMGPGGQYPMNGGFYPGNGQGMFRPPTPQQQQGNMVMNMPMQGPNYMMANQQPPYNQQQDYSNQWQPMMQPNMNQSNFMMQGNAGYGGYNGNMGNAMNSNPNMMGRNMAPQQQMGGNPGMQMMCSNDRQSPMVQVPHITQSQLTMPGQQPHNQNQGIYNRYSPSFIHLL